ncbi:MAG: HU family DNA-binding protein [bacterium]
MNKLELIDMIAEKMGFSKRVASEMVECVFGTVTEKLKAGEDVNIGSFGMFRVKSRAARTGVNPRTGEKIQIQASRAPVFRPSKTLKDAIR